MKPFFHQRIVLGIFCTAACMIMTSCKPDLTGSISGPAFTGYGDDVREEITVTVQNTGDIMATDFFVDLVLSSNSTVPVQLAVYSDHFSDDVLLKGGRTHVNELAAGESVEVQATLKGVIPDDTPPGIYYLGVVFDSGDDVDETNETSDNTAVCVIEIMDPYVAHVKRTRVEYAKSAAWETWMIANQSRYNQAFETSRFLPEVLEIAFRYDSAPIAYSPPWASETEHMNALETFAELCYPGYNFEFILNGDVGASYANVIAGIPTNSSHASGKNVWVYYEAIFNHEFGHVMGIHHHYDTDEETGDGNHMPPGEFGCLMDRNQSQYCSACRSALHLPLDIDNQAALSTAGGVISSRYPY